MSIWENDTGEGGWRAALDKCRLTVTAGAHKGASVVNSSGSITVGRSENCDIVLFADDIEPAHFRVKVEPGLLGKLVVHALQGPIQIKGRSLVDVGEYCDIAAGAEIIAGSAMVRVERLADPNNLAVPALRAGIVVLALATAWVGWSLLTTLANLIPAGASSVMETVSAPVSREIGAVMGTPASKEAANLEAFAWRARAQLEDLGLNRGLRVASGAPGVLKITGTISEAQSSSWNEFLRWYDANPDFPKLIREVSRSEVETGLPALQSVWLDGEPTVYFKDGASATVGETVNGDWKIKEINAASVLVERDGSTVALTF
jgi:hypothetical protein